MTVSEDTKSTKSDEEAWAKPVSKLSVGEAPEEAMNLNVDGREVVGWNEKNSGGEREAFELFIMNVDGVGLLKLTDTRTSNLYPTFQPPKPQEN